MRSVKDHVGCPETNNLHINSTLYGRPQINGVGPECQVL